MSKASELISNYFASSSAKPDSNLANDSLHLGGVKAEDYALKTYVSDVIKNLTESLTKYIDTGDSSVLASAKAYTDLMISSQDFSDFAKLTDLQALREVLEAEIHSSASSSVSTSKDYTDTKIGQVSEAINTLNQYLEEETQQRKTRDSELFQYVSNGKTKVARAITDKGVSTSATDTFDTMATNIRSIPQGGTDTYDATATPSDILEGKTAYVKGQKIYGRYVAPSNPEYNPSNPYPTYGEVEFIYADKADEVDIGDPLTIPNNLNKYAITSDGGTMMLGYDSSDSKFKILVKTYNAETGKYTYVQKAAIDSGGNQYLLTPEYSLSDLGIPDGVTINAISFARMNDDPSESGYDTKVAIATSENIIYVFKFYTGDFWVNPNKRQIGKIFTENEEVTIGIEGDTTTQTKYNKWVVNAAMGIAIILWSPFSDTLGVGGGTWYTLKLYQFETLIPSTDDEDFGKVNLRSSYDLGSQGSAWYAGGMNVKILDNDRLVLIGYHHNYGEGGYVQRVAVYSNNFLTRKSLQNMGDNYHYIFSYDGRYAIKGNKLYSVITNYEAGGINFTELATLGVTLNVFQQNSGFSKKNTFLFAGAKIYHVDFTDYTISLLDSNTYTFVGFLTDLATLRVSSESNVYNFVKAIVDRQQVVGLKYQGEMYYKQVYPTGSMSAVASDVLYGKTFIGNAGTIETGTMEVNEDE